MIVFFNKRKNGENKSSMQISGQHLRDFFLVFLLFLINRNGFDQRYRVVNAHNRPCNTQMLVQHAHTCLSHLSLRETEEPTNSHPKSA